MTIAPAAASAAYQALQNIGSNAPVSSVTIDGGQKAPSFGDFLSGAMKEAVGTLKSGEEMAAKAAAGQADIVNVVNAVNQAELTLDTVVAVRDKVIAAYQSIMQMPI
ncbi:MAG TPA: flagellar hook-basal body complex protein FliE [Rhizomicrobium sp.]|nr:flagellar hook-basal body complex protein FliE [Rhizomicrobium sp.]